MTRGLYNAVTGMVREMGHQDVIAGNLANVNTVGFKRDVAVSLEFNRLLIQHLEDPTLIANVPPDSTNSPEVTTMIDVSQGTITETGNPLDVALVGKGFFVVETPQGQAYTRQGNFRKDERGFLVTPQGYRVLDDAGRPIRLDDQRSATFDEQGNVLVLVDGQEFPIAKLRLVEMPPGVLLQKAGNGLVNALGANPIPARETTVKGKALEQSNVNPIQEMVAMLVVFRNYEAAQRMVQAQDEATQRAIEQVGNVR